VISESTLILDRQEYSKHRLEELRKRISNIKEVELFPKITIYCAGSYARLEASEYSDIDLFFLYSAAPNEIEEPKTSQIRLFSKLIEIIEDMRFPKLSNDGEYLILNHTSDLIDDLGSRGDDFKNFFTARMLLLLESQCIYKDEIYDDAIKRVIDAYFRDYPGHESSFRPTFLVNDIIRYWKTLCLNYENKRNKPTNNNEKLIKQKVKNFKLKFSRMNTCFAMIAGLLCQESTIDQELIFKLVHQIPMERLDIASSFIPEGNELLEELRVQYSWFLQLTGLPTEELHAKFDDDEFRHSAFSKANMYGDSMFRLLQLIDKKNNYLRYLVI
jgi:predicted nucleotidyltransferase